MGIITNGFLIGSRKSAGGINFLRLKGQQVFRNKPQVSAQYVPSGAQVVQRSLQAALTKAIKADADILMLVSGGWDRHDAKRTNMNEFMRFAARVFTREADGSLSTIADKESRMTAAEAAGYDVYIRQKIATGDLPLTKSSFAFPSALVVRTATGVTLNPDAVNSVKQELGLRFSQDFVNTTPFEVVSISAAGVVSVAELTATEIALSAGTPFAIRAAATRSGSIYRYVISTSELM